MSLSKQIITQRNFPHKITAGPLATLCRQYFQVLPSVQGLIFHDVLAKKTIRISIATPSPTCFSRVSATSDTWLWKRRSKATSDTTCLRYERSSFLGPLPKTTRKADQKGCVGSGPSEQGITHLVIGFSVNSVPREKGRGNGMAMRSAHLNG